MLGTITALGVGILLLLFAENELQVIQFIPLVISPRILLGGAFLPVEERPVSLEPPG